MSILFGSAKNGQNFCTVNGFALHSAYDPKKEAERIFLQEKPDYFPQIIIVINSGLPYYAQKIREYFPVACLISLQTTDDFSNKDSVWNNEWTPSKMVPLSTFLEQYINEETAAGLWFTVWPAGCRIWKKETAEYVSVISQLLHTAKAIHDTRSYFGRRWLLNIVKNTLLIDNPITVTSVHVPILIVAAGPSLEQVIPVIKKVLPYIYIIAVSSALSVLLNNNIIPDMCITSDGGYYAAEHLNAYKRIQQNHLPVIAATSESFIPYHLLKKQQMLLMSYGTPLEQELRKITKLPLFIAKRNGTVTGTATELALSLTDNIVYIAGLDLQNIGGKSHSFPNEAFSRRSATATRLTPETGAITDRDDALDTYARWFDSRPDSFCKRVFLLGKTLRRYTSLRKMSEEQFLANINHFSDKSQQIISQGPINKTQKLKTAKSLFKMLETQIQTVKQCPTFSAITTISKEDSITGDFIRYVAWQELANLIHSSYNSKQAVELCNTALDAINYIINKIEHWQESIR